MIDLQVTVDAFSSMEYQLSCYRQAMTMSLGRLIASFAIFPFGFCGCDGGYHTAQTLRSIDEILLASCGSGMAWPRLLVSLTLMIIFSLSERRAAAKMDSEPDLLCL